MATYDVRRERLWVNIVGNGLYVLYILVGGGGDKKKKKQQRCTKVEFSDSLGDSEVVRVLGNAILQMHHKKGMVQAPASGPVNARRLTVPFRKQKQADFTPVGNHGLKRFARPENAANVRCSQLANGDGRPNADRCRKGAHPAPGLLFLLGSVVLSLLLPCVIFRVVFSFGSTSQRVRYWGLKDPDPC